MFAARYFAPRYFARRYFPKLGGSLGGTAIAVLNYYRKLLLGG